MDQLKLVNLSMNICCGLDSWAKAAMVNSALWELLAGYN